MLSSVEPDSLKDELERLLSEGGRPTRVVSLTRRANPYATLAPNEILTLTVENGETIELFLKHLSVQEANHPNKLRRDREILVYEELLASSRGLPVPWYYGARWDESNQRGWLVLECLDDWCLKYHSLDRWFEAARWLARLHKHFAVEMSRLEDAGFLLRLDRPYFVAWFKRAKEAVEQRSMQLGEALMPVVERAAEFAELLGTQCRTLVHNDLAPKNVLASRPGEPLRINLVDWEMAGVGCGVLDLVQLKDGLNPVADRRMRDVYCDELAGTGLLPEESPQVDRLFAACDLHKTLYRLARSSQWKLSIDTLEQWVEEASRQARRI